MFVTSVKLTLLVIGAVVLVMMPLILFGRWVRTLEPPQPGPHRRHQRARQRNPERGADGAGLHARRRRARALSARRSRLPSTSPILRTRARAVMTAVVIFAAFGRIVGVLLGRRAGCDRPSHDGRAAGAIHLLCRHRRRRRRRDERNLGRSAARGRRLGTADGTAAREAGIVGAGASGRHCRSPARGAVVVRECHLPLSLAARFRGAERISRWTSRRARRWRWSVRPAPANRRCSSCCCASSRRRAARSPSTASILPMLDPVRPSPQHRGGGAGQRDLLRHACRQHPLWPPRCERRRCAPRRRSRRRRRIHRRAAAGLSRPSSASAA